MSSRTRQAFFAALALSLPSLALLAGLELATRAHTREWTWVNFLERDLSLLKGETPADFDPKLGWIPRPGFEGKSRDWAQPVHINALGLRENGRASSSPLPPALALGDSFTFGVDVNDAETWPSQLQAMSGRPVANGGVFGYGLDQSVLRLERLFGQLKPQPKLVILSFIEDDIRRAEDRRRFGADKPYFSVKNGSLVLHDDAIQPPKAQPSLGALREILGYSCFADRFFRRFRAEWWALGSQASIHVDDDGAEIAALLMKRLAGLAKKKHFQVLVVAQYWREIKPAEAADCAVVLKAAEAAGLKALDIAPLLQAVKESDPERYAGFFRGHMTEAGNAWLAQQIFNALKQNRFL